MRLKIDEAIKESGLKKGYIADKLNVSHDTLTHWCKNRSYPRLDQAVKLADILQRDIKELYIKNSP